MKKTVVTIILTILVLAVIGVYTYLIIYDGGTVGGTVPLALYILYISFYYHRRAGWLAAIGAWLVVNLLFEKPFGKFSLDGALILLAFWYLLVVECGHLAGRYKKWKDSEIKKREIYTASAAHELKTPIAVMKLRVSMIQKKDPVLAGILIREIERLQSLIERMMDYSKISSGKYVLAYGVFRLDELVEGVVSNVHNVHPGAKLRRHLPDKPMYIEGDKGALEQIFINLLTNAIKHCPAKPIDITLKKHTPHWIQFSVKDQGDGIPDKVKEKIFAPFVQGSNASPGLGMGLYIVRKIVDLHKGMVYFNSNKKGTEFFVELPENRKVKDTRAKYRIG